MVEGEDYNFLRFATALKIIVGRTFRIDRLDYVKTLLRDYLLNFLEVCIASRFLYSVLNSVRSMVQRASCPIIIGQFTFLINFWIMVLSTIFGPS